MILNHKFLFLLIIGLVKGSPQEDLVKIDEIFGNSLAYNHKWYSGYLQASQEYSNIFYQFFESQNQPKTDPIIVWLQGGPYCSSLFGAFYENGPIQFYPSSKDAFVNQYSWNKKANLLYLETPPGVGFSQPAKYQASDESTTIDTHAALIDFFNNKFPELNKNEVYFAGESYAGIYIPNLANYILNDGTNQINLKGFLIGNGCTLGEECTDYGKQINGYSWFTLEQFNDHAFIGFEDWDKFTKSCKKSNFYKKQICVDMIYSMTDRFSFDYVDLNNLNGKCYHSPGYEQLASRKNTYKTKTLHQKFHKQETTNPGKCDFEVGDYFLLNNQTIRQALHISQQVSNFFWTTCSDYGYQSDPQGTYHLYPQLLNKGLRILIYSGDVDANVPITGTLQWVEMLRKEMNLKITDEWRPWFIAGKRPQELQVGGMTFTYGNLTFASVRGAGHEVPFWQPESSYVLIDSFLKSSQLPKKTKERIFQKKKSSKKSEGKRNK